MSAIDQELKKLQTVIGIEIGPFFIEIERWMIKKCAEAIGCPDSGLQDKLYAQWLKQPLVPAEAVLSYFATHSINAALDIRPAKGSGVRGMFMGSKLEFHTPISVGDIISCTGSNVSLSESEGRMMGNLGQEGGKILLHTMEITYKNQREEVVMKGWYTFARYLYLI